MISLRFQVMTSKTTHFFCSKNAAWAAVQKQSFKNSKRSRKITIPVPFVYSKIYYVKISKSSSLPIFYRKSFSRLQSDLLLSDCSLQKYSLKINRKSVWRNSSWRVVLTMLSIYCKNFMSRFTQVSGYDFENITLFLQ